MELDCGIPERRIVSWLGDELALAREGDRWTFADPAGNACSICTRQLENRTLGIVSIERTLVTVTGNACAIDEFYRLFTLKFISAGG